MWKKSASAGWGVFTYAMQNENGKGRSGEPNCSLDFQLILLCSSPPSLPSFDIFGIIHWRVFWRFSDANGSLLLDFLFRYILLDHTFSHLPSKNSANNHLVPPYQCIYSFMVTLLQEGVERHASFCHSFETEISWYSLKESEFPIIFKLF